MKGSYLIFILFGLLSPSALNLGMGMQKYGIDGLGRFKEFFRDGVVRRQLVVWVIGTLLTTLAMVFGFVALNEGGNASTLGSLAGFGLIVLVLFSYFVLKEEITAREMLGIVLIMIGTSAMGAFSTDTQTAEAVVNRSGMIWFFIGFGVFCLLSAALLKFGGGGITGAVMGVLSGAIGAIGVVFMKVVTEWTVGCFVHHEISFFQYFTNPYVYLAFVPGILSFLVLQFAYKHGKAVTIVPSLNSALIVGPTITAMAILNEPVSSMQWISLSTIVVGVLFISSPKMADSAVEPAVEEVG